MAQLILLLFPVPKSIMICLLRKKNMTVHGSYSSYMVLKSGISDKSTKYMTAKFFSWSAVVARICSPAVQGLQIAAKTVLKLQDGLATWKAKQDSRAYTYLIHLHASLIPVMTKPDYYNAVFFL